MLAELLLRMAVCKAVLKLPPPQLLLVTQTFAPYVDFIIVA